MLPHGNGRRDFIEALQVSPALCNRLWYSVCGFAVASASRYARCTFSPVPLAGLLFGRPYPLPWLPDDARRMPRRDFSAGALFLWAWYGPCPLQRSSEHFCLGQVEPASCNFFRSAAAAALVGKNLLARRRV